MNKKNLNKLLLILVSILLWLNPISNIYGGLASNIWLKNELSVCFLNGTSNETVRNRVRFAIENTWGYYSKLKFVRWDECNDSDKDNANPNRADIKINSPVNRAHSEIGTRCKNYFPSMELNFDENNSWGSLNFERRLENVAVHEFGHAIGLLHEQARSDVPDSCHDRLDNSDGNNNIDYSGYKIGTYDSYSIMNYCAGLRKESPPFYEVLGHGEGMTAGLNPFFGLSNGDVHIVQTLYGVGAGGEVRTLEKVDAKAPVAKRVKVIDGVKIVWGEDGYLYRKDGENYVKVIEEKVKSFDFNQKKSNELIIVTEGGSAFISDPSGGNRTNLTFDNIITASGSALPLEIKSTNDGYIIMNNKGSAFKVTLENGQFKTKEVLDIGLNDAAHIFVNEYNNDFYVLKKNGILMINGSYTSQPNGKKITNVFTIMALLFVQDEDGLCYKYNYNTYQYERYPEFDKIRDLYIDNSGIIHKVGANGEVLELVQEPEDCRISEGERKEHRKQMEDFAYDKNKSLGHLAEIANALEWMEHDAFRFTLDALIIAYVAVIAVFSIIAPAPIGSTIGLLLILIAGVLALLAEILFKLIFNEPTEVAAACIKNLPENAKERQAVLVSLDYQWFYLYRYYFTMVQYIVLWLLFLEALIENLIEVAILGAAGGQPTLTTSPVVRVAVSGLASGLLTLMVFRIITLLPLAIELRKEWEKDVNNYYSKIEDLYFKDLNIFQFLAIFERKDIQNSFDELRDRIFNFLIKNANAIVPPTGSGKKEVPWGLKYIEKGVPVSFCMTEGLRPDIACGCKKDNSCFNPLTHPAFQERPDLAERIDSYMYLMDHPNEANLQELLVTAKEKINLSKKIVKENKEKFDQEGNEEKWNLFDSFEPKNFLQKALNKVMNPTDEDKEKAKKFREDYNLAPVKDISEKSTLMLNLQNLGSKIFGTTPNKSFDKMLSNVSAVKKEFVKSSPVCYGKNGEVAAKDYMDNYVMPEGIVQSIIKRVSEDIFQKISERYKKWFSKD